MGQYEWIVKFILEHADLFGTLLATLITIVKLTSWGKGKSDALDTVVTVIEQLGAKDVKGGVVAQEGNLTPEAKDAIQHAVAKADPKKTPEALAVRILKNILGAK
jgi:hypothetical protein